MAGIKSFLHKLIFNQTLVSRFFVKMGINFDGERKIGNAAFSLIYKADDKELDKEVVLKFFDPDLQLAERVYRYEAFKREAEILKRLKDKKRCAQLITGIQKFQHNLKTELGDFPIDASFYSMEFYPKDYEGLVMRHNVADTISKLQIFRKMLLATRALHLEDIYHRDIKIEHFRGYDLDGEENICLVDFGTSISKNDSNMEDKYLVPVGTYEYSSPEQRAGLISYRNVQPSSDIFALGAILFEMFSTSSFAEVYYEKEMLEIVRRNQLLIFEQVSDEKKYSKYIELIDKEKAGFNSSMLSSYLSVPTALSIEIPRIISDMTAFDFRRRKTIIQILGRVDICLNILRNEASQKKIYALRKKRTEERLQRLGKREQ